MIDYTYFSDKDLIVTIFHGPVAVEELNELIDKLIAIEHHNGAMRGLTILCENVKMDAIKYHNIFSAGKRMSRATFRKNGKNAIVAHTALGYGISRIYQVATEITSLDETRVYKGDEGLQEAISWLDAKAMLDEIQGLIARCTDELPE